RFGEATKYQIRKRVVRKQPNVARVKPFGLVEVRLAPLPLTSPARHIGQGFRNTAAIGQKLACLFKVTLCGVVIFQARIVIIPLGQNCLAEIGLKSQRGLSSLSRLFAQGVRWLETPYEVAARIYV